MNNTELHSLISNHCKLLDVRSTQDFENKHLARSVNIEAKQLFVRMHELSKADEALLVIGDAENLAIAREFFVEKSYLRTHYCAFDNLEELSRSGANIEFSCGVSQTTLWQPSAFIEQLATTHIQQHSLNTNSALDIACGSGRDLVYLAKLGFQSYGIDYNEDALTRAQSLAQNNQQAITLAQLNLEPEGLAPTKLPAKLPKQYSLVCVFRYLHRPLFPLIRSLIEPGGAIAYQTFMQGCEKISRPKNPRFLLAPGELREVFHDFDILIDETEHLDDGRPVARFLARKPRL